MAVKGNIRMRTADCRSNPMIPYMLLHICNMQTQTQATVMAEPHSFSPISQSPTPSDTLWIQALGAITVFPWLATRCPHPAIAETNQNH